MQASAVLFETPEQVYARVFREIRPRAAMPEFKIIYRRFANANSFIRMEDGRIEVRICDLLEGAPAPIVESLAYILLSKLFRRQVPAAYALRYRRYLNSREMSRSVHLVRQLRGRKFLSGPQGEYYNLEEIFEELNARFFHGLLARPDLGWSRRPSRTMLGHFDLSHNAIILSRILDRPVVPRLAIEYVLYHEMLHLRFPVQHRGARRCVHTQDFQRAEREFPELKAARDALKKL
jgi:SprT-like family protein